METRTLSKIEDLLVKALRAAARNEVVECDTFRELSPVEWQMFYALAAGHKLLPMIYEATYAYLADRAKETEDPESEYSLMLKMHSRRAVMAVLVQTAKSAAFLDLYRFMEEKGLHPVVVKGIVLRAIYPDGDHRPSADEDIVIPKEEWERAVQALREYGMEPIEEVTDNAFEIGWRKKSLYVELHRDLFEPDTEFGRQMVELFDGALLRTGVAQVTAEKGKEPVAVRTFSETDHLLYLIAHAYKHFVHSGFGLRQILDIALFAEVYGDKVDFRALREKCRKVHAEKFAAACFMVSEKYLGIPVKALSDGVDTFADLRAIDPAPLLADLTSAGLYGTSSLSRAHSATVTKNAVEAHRENRKSSVWKSAFPGRAKLVGAYPELKKYPILLPFVWVKRLFRYGMETKTERNSELSETLRIAKERTELLKYYDILG